MTPKAIRTPEDKILDHRKNDRTLVTILTLTLRQLCVRDHRVHDTVKLFVDSVKLATKLSSMSEQDKTKRPHHHGDLRNALVDAGIALLTEGGAQALTLRKCAARAGVSHAAPAHHFNGLAGLKHAIALEGFHQLRALMTNCDGCTNPDALTRLKSMCLCYIEFAVAHPALFDEMFSINAKDIIEGNVTEELQGIYMNFRSFCLPFVHEDLSLETIELQVRSFLRGYTHIAVSGQFGPKGKDGYPLGPVDAAMGILDHLALPPARSPGKT